VGLTSWLLAFLIAYLGRINPVHLNVWSVTLLVLSAVCGLLAAIAVGKRYCRHDFERDSAVKVFALSFFSGIYAPITAIWANAPFYAWSATQNQKPSTEIVRAVLAPAVAKMVISYYLASAILLIAGLVIQKRIGHACGRNSFRSANSMWNLDWVDIGFGLVCIIVGLLAVQEIRGMKIEFYWRGWQQGTPLITIRGDPWTILTEIAWWYRYCVAALLLCFIFRSLRLDQRALDTVPANVDATDCRSKTSRRFLARVSSWSGVTLSLLLFGLMFPRMARIGALKGSTIIAIPVHLLEPLFCVCLLPAMMTLVGGFVIIWFVPRLLKIGELTSACAAAGMAVGGILHLLCAQFITNIWLCTIQSMPASDPLSDASLHSRMVEGHWVGLGMTSMGILGINAVTWAVIWTVQAIMASSVRNLLARRTLSGES
jgi:hypothetical protein